MEKLLKHIRHELVTITGLKAFDSKSENIKQEKNNITIPCNEIIEYDYNNLVKQIDYFIDDESSNEIKNINNIYDTLGFKGVIEEVQSRLKYGNVTLTDGLYRITTGGWSDDEYLLDCLISMTCKFHRHYMGYKVGGSFYFDETRDIDEFLKVRMIKYDGIKNGVIVRRDLFNEAMEVISEYDNDSLYEDLNKTSKDIRF